MNTSATTPRFLKAKTAKALERLMLLNNARRKSFHQYSIVFDGKDWYAWFYVDISGSFNLEGKEILGEDKIS